MTRSPWRTPVVVPVCDTFGILVWFGIQPINERSVARLTATLD